MGEGHSPLNGARAILFDLDGTLIDSYDAIHDSLSTAMRAEGLTPLSYEKVRAMVGRGLEALVADVIGPDRVAEGVACFRQRYREICLDKTRWLPEVPETLGELHRRGVRMAVCSNKPGYFGKMLLDHLGGGRWFDAVLGPEQVSRPKPDPEMLQLAMEKLGIEPDDCLYVGDMPMDVTVARAAGVRVGVLATGSSSREDLEAADADLVFDRFADLLSGFGGEPEQE